MGASEKVAAAFHPHERATSAAMVRAVVEVEKALESEIHHAEDNGLRIEHHGGPGRHAVAVPATYVRAAVEGARRTLGLPVPDASDPAAVTVVAADLLAGMREQMSEAQRHRDEPGYSRLTCDAMADAFGTVIDWFEDVYLPDVTS